MNNFDDEFMLTFDLETTRPDHRFDSCSKNPASFNHKKSDHPMKNAKSKFDWQYFCTYCGEWLDKFKV